MVKEIQVLNHKLLAAALVDDEDLILLDTSNYSLNQSI